MSSLGPSEIVPLLYDHYEIDRLLGRGGSGAVYLARDVRIHRRVALKTISDRDAETSTDTATYERFRREAEVCGSLVHPNIVTLYEVGFEGKRLKFLAMEFVDGETLHALLRRYEVIPVDHAIRIIDDLLQGLAYAHERGVIHRDVKPANVLIAIDGTAKLTDFGIATSIHRVVSELTARNQILGTPHYMSPEAVAGRPLDGRSDLYSLGVLAWEMLAGRKPHDGESVTEVLYKVVNEIPPPLLAVAPDAPSWYANFVDRLLEKDPKNRFLSASTAAREWRRLAENHARTRTQDSTPRFQVPAEFTPTKSIKRGGIRRLQQSVSTAAGIAIIGTATALAATAVVVIQREIREPVDHIPHAVSSKFEERKRIFSEANALADAGAFRQARERYELLLRDQPGSVAAQEGLKRVEEAEKALNADRPGSRRRVAVRAEEPQEELTVAASPAPAPPSLENAPQERLTVGRRLKRFFSRKKEQQSVPQKAQ